LVGNRRSGTNNMKEMQEDGEYQEKTKDEAPVRGGRRIRRGGEKLPTSSAEYHTREDDEREELEFERCIPPAV
jgi:hypothetical protein